MEDNNIKGVMLCERPSDPPVAAIGPAFVPGNVCRDPPGIAPPRKLMPSRTKNKDTPLHRHILSIKKTGETILVKKKETEELEREAKEREEALRKRSEQYHRTVLSRPADSDGSEAAKHAEVAAATGQGASYTKSRPPELTIPKTPNFVTSLPQTLPDETMADIEKEMADLIEGALSLGESPAPSAGQTKHVPDAQVSREETKDAPGAPHGEAAMALAKNGAMPSCASEEGMREREGETAVGQGEATGSGKLTKQEMKALRKKPKWALTEREADALEEAEVAELLDFAEGLDFDEYLGHIEDEDLRAAMEAIQPEEEGVEAGVGLEGLKKDAAWKRDFVRAMNHVTLQRAQARAMRNGGRAESVAGQSEGASTFQMGTEVSKAREKEGAEKRAALEAASEKRDKGWDGSTRVGDDSVARMEEAGKAREAEELLRENPDMRAVHSRASAKRMLEAATGNVE